MKSVAFINLSGSVDTTSLVYHLAWMFSELGKRVLAVDLDPQANLSAMFLDESRLEEVWRETGTHSSTLLGVVEPILKGVGDIAIPHVEEMSSMLGLLIGDLGLARFEAKLSASWPSSLDRDESAFRTISPFYRAIVIAAETTEADIVLIDVGPNLGAINRSALLAAENVVVPLSADLFSLQGLRNLGPTLREWRGDWADRMGKKPSDPRLRLPTGTMQPIGYVIQQHARRMDRPVLAYNRWMSRIPYAYAEYILEERLEEGSDETLHCLATLKNYRSLMPLAHDARKPMFFLKSADGSLGGHLKAVQDCYLDFSRLALEIVERTADSMFAVHR